jgi:hypothetical protein
MEQLPLFCDAGEGEEPEGEPLAWATVGRRLVEAPPVPLIVAYGLGVDSTAILVELGRRYRTSASNAWRPDAVLFADTGGEKPETYQYLPVMNQYLRSVGFPKVTVVKYKPKKAPYTTLEGNCRTNKTLPSLAYGRKSCSLKWKKQPQDKWVKENLMAAHRVWAAGRHVYKILGYDAGPKDDRRAWRLGEDPWYRYWYPLREWGWDRERCVAEIVKEGLPGWNPDNEGPGKELVWVESGGIPTKSACWFCPAGQTWEIARLVERHPNLAVRIIGMEADAAPGNITVEGLWRSSTKKRPGSMTAFILPLLEKEKE